MAAPINSGSGVLGNQVVTAAITFTTVPSGSPSGGHLFDRRQATQRSVDAKRTFIRNLLSLKKRRKFGVHHFQLFSSPFTENSLVKCEISLPPCISKWAAAI